MLTYHYHSVSVWYIISAHSRSSNSTKWPKTRISIFDQKKCESSENLYFFTQIGTILSHKTTIFWKFFLDHSKLWKPKSAIFNEPHYCFGYFLGVSPQFCPSEPENHLSKKKFKTVFQNSEGENNGPRGHDIHNWYLVGWLMKYFSQK